MSFTYNNMHWLSPYFVDDYVDLNSQQNKQLKQYVKEVRDWHRANALPEYVAWLKEMKAIVNDSPTLPAIQAHFDEASTFWDDVSAQLAPRMTALALTLNDEQRNEFITTIDDEIKKDIEKWQERMKDKEKQRAKYYERELDEFEDYLGKLTEEQKAIIMASIEQNETTFLYWQDYRKNRLDAARLVLLGDYTEAAFVAELEKIILNREDYMSEEYIRIRDEQQQRYLTLLIDLRATLSQKQLDKINDYFDDLIDDLEDLIED